MTMGSEEMADDSWVKEFPGFVVVCDTAGIIVEMNDRAVEWFADRGGRELVGKNLLEVHREQAQAKIRQMTERRENNVYTIDKDGARVLIYQSPWYRDGKFAGLVEFGLEIPLAIPHHARTPSG
jgi:transcriptional regulator with PAS, ATPase and Fis domain